MKLSRQELEKLIQVTGTDYSKKNLTGKCPKCNQNEFGISLDENHKFGCYRLKKCGFSGNIFTLLKFLGKLEEYTKDDSRYKNSIGKLISGIQEPEKIVEEVLLQEVYKPVGWKRIYYHDYLEKRGFTKKYYEKYYIGTTHLDPYLKDFYIIILIVQKGLVVGYVSRHIWDKKQILEHNKKNPKNPILRYKNSTSQLSLFLYGIEECNSNTHTIIIVEGFFDKTVTEEIVGGEGVVVCCTWKCDISPSQIEDIKKVKGLKNIILLYDPDVLQQVIRTGNKLSDSFNELNIYIGWNENGNDPGDMDEKEFIEVIDNMEKIEKFAYKKISKKELR